MTSTSRRIALVSAFPPGMQSLNEYGLHLAKGFAARPDVSEVVVIADILDKETLELELGDKIRVERVWRFNSVRAPMNILRALRKCRPDGVVYNVQTASFGDRELPAGLGLMTPMLSRKLGYASGVIAHNTVDGIDLESTVLKGQKIRQRIVRTGAALVTRLMTGASYLTVTLSGYEQSLKAKFPKRDITMVPHGTFDTDAREMAPLDQRPLRIVTMGKFGTYKKLETLLKAFDILRTDPAFAEAELVIGGTDHPNANGYLSVLAVARDEDAGVHFHGYVAEEDIPAFFGQARLSVFDYETTTGSSGVLHQTASYGAVPVFPKIGDFVDLCEDEGLTGAHYEVGDEAGMARAMHAMLNDLDEAQKIAQENRVAAEGMPFSDVIDFHMRKLFSTESSHVAEDKTEDLKQAA